ncbi:hypothetical protein [Streptomyces cahuitamycinicus]|uniref:Uncharacterized protein n=1 Tax=Streptomyces cahuitamycinicus TaxID=2070367 RepID=A0A2N8TTI5_9ACTN|nr:hypothetical protein [Streptomyces cahuitamycinicus]PNG22329.1 hypothetical protein C1J00_09955 [Streptomyces cahuitamycinicus]
MNTLLEALAGQAEALVNGVVALAGGLVIWRLTNRSRDRADQQTELATFRERADALIVAVVDVRAAADLNHRLWERPWEQARFLAVAAFAAVGEGARVRALGGSDRHMFAAAGGAAAQLGLREIHANKTSLAALREPLVRVHEAAAPFLRHADQRVVTATNELLAAVGDIKDRTRLEAALAAFGQAVVAVADPRPSLWARLRSRRSRD